MSQAQNSHAFCFLLCGGANIPEGILKNLEECVDPTDHEEVDSERCIGSEVVPDRSSSLWSVTLLTMTLH